MTRRILYTARDNTVRVCVPARECMRLLQGGGYYRNPTRGTLERAVAWEVERGRSPDEARRWVRALAFGGNTEAEALGLIRDKDCAPHGSAFELVDPEDLPPRTFRDAWRRGHNGGPISIHLETARGIQFHRIKRAVVAHNDREEWGLRQPSLIIPEWGAVRDRLRTANDEVAIAAVWVDGVPRQEGQRR